MTDHADRRWPVVVAPGRPRRRWSGGVTRFSAPTRCTADRAGYRSWRSHRAARTSAIMPGGFVTIIAAGQRPVPTSGTPQAADVIVSRCAGLDAHKNTVMACVQHAERRTVGGPRRCAGSGPSLRRCGSCGTGWSPRGSTQVATEATGVYWKPVWHVLAGTPGLELMLVNAHAVKNMPGREDRRRRRGVAGRAVRARAAAAQLRAAAAAGPVAGPDPVPQEAASCPISVGMVTSSSS